MLPNVRLANEPSPFPLLARLWREPPDFQLIDSGSFLSRYLKNSRYLIAAAIESPCLLRVAAYQGRELQAYITGTRERRRCIMLEVSRFPISDRGERHIYRIRDFETPESAIRFAQEILLANDWEADLLPTDCSGNVRSLITRNRQIHGKVSRLVKG